MRMRVAAYQLFIKYVERGATMEINVCSRDRDYLTNLLQSKKEWLNTQNNALLKDIVHLFDTVMFRNYALLRGSYMRFKETPQYQLLLLLDDQALEDVK